MSSKSILNITDCIDTIDLLNIADGILICEWLPAVAPLKGGGVWQSSPLVDGKRLSYKNFDNTVETFNLTIKGNSQDAVIAFLQSLTTMLEKAVAYWTTSWQKQPVWIQARGATESNSRYAVIKAYTIDGLSNPYSQPFFGNCSSMMDKITLVVERDHWIDQVPGTALAIGLNNLQNYLKTDTVTIAKSCMQPSDDALNTDGSTHTIDPTASYNRVGIAFVSAVNTYYDCGLRFPSINIPQGATILQANLQVTAYPATSAGIVLPEYDEHDLTLWIYGELVANASIFNDSVSDYMLRHIPLTSAKTEFISPATTWRVGHETKYIDGLASVIQEIVNQNSWVSGNAIALWLMLADLSHEDNYRSFGSVDNGFPPILNITYTTVPEEGLAGHEDTTSGNVYIANKHNQAQITHIFTKPSGGALSGNLVGTALPWTLLPTPNPGVGDEVYFGINEDVNTCGPLDNLVFDISVISENLKLAWSRSDGAGGWTTSLSYSDKSVDLDKLGEYMIDLSNLSGGKNTVGAITGYWIKATVASTSGATVAPQQETREVYTCITPFVDIDGSDIFGEISALARIRVTHVPTNQDYTNTVIVGSRSKARGNNFTPYLNFSDVQNISGVTSPYILSMVDDVTTPTGRCISLTDDIERDEWLTTYAQIIIDSSLSGEYHGSFHAYLRYRQTIGNNGDFDLRLKYSMNNTGSWLYTSSISSLGGGEAAYTSVADFGVINIGTYSLGFDDNLGNIIFEIEYRHNVDTSSTIKVQDLILIPTDEWFGAFQASSKGSFGDLLIGGRILDIDSIGNPRSARAILRTSNIGELLNEQFSSEWIKATRGGPFLQSQSDQRLWFLTYYEFLGGTDGDVLYKRSYIYNFYKINTYIANRYLTMRGAI